MTNGRYIDIENDVLRQRLQEIKAAAKSLCEGVERYARQEILRSELMIRKDRLKGLLK